MSHSAASDLGLHCLSITLLRVSRLQWVKTKSSFSHFDMLLFSLPILNVQSAAYSTYQIYQIDCYNFPRVYIDKFKGNRYTFGADNSVRTDFCFLLKRGPCGSKFIPVRVDPFSEETRKTGRQTRSQKSCLHCTK